MPAPSIADMMTRRFYSGVDAGKVDIVAAGREGPETREPNSGPVPLILVSKLEVS